jgi:hypothetical protein
VGGGEVGGGEGPGASCECLGRGSLSLPLQARQALRGRAPATRRRPLCRGAAAPACPSLATLDPQTLFLQPPGRDQARRHHQRRRLCGHQPAGRQEPAQPGAARAHHARGAAPGGPGCWAERGERGRRGMGAASAHDIRRKGPQAGSLLRAWPRTRSRGPRPAPNRDSAAQAPSRTTPSLAPSPPAHPPAHPPTHPTAAGVERGQDGAAAGALPPLQPGAAPKLRDPELRRLRVRGGASHE